MEVKLAILETQMKAVLEGIHEAREAREKRDEKLEVFYGDMNQKMNSFDHRMEKVENQLASNAPTIEEFITIKHQVKGAGMLGKWAWMIGGFLIAFLFNARSHIKDIFP
jgi:chromosome segregation ATPase